MSDGGRRTRRRRRHAEREGRQANLEDIPSSHNIIASTNEKFDVAGVLLLALLEFVESAEVGACFARTSRVSNKAAVEASV